MSWGASVMDYYVEIARHEAGRIARTAVPGAFHFAVKEPLAPSSSFCPSTTPSSCYSGRRRRHMRPSMR